MHESLVERIAGIETKLSNTFYAFAESNQILAASIVDLASPDGMPGLLVSMTVNLSPHGQELLEAALARGVGRSPEEVVERALATIADPVAAALRNAPMDDEPETEEEKQAAAEARAWLQRNGGKGIPHAEAMRQLGLE
ncbi:MAG: hypothetical protein WBL61_04195 [Bryobacteraceae bacterium]